MPAAPAFADGRRNHGRTPFSGPRPVAAVIFLSAAPGRLAAAVLDHGKRPRLAYYPALFENRSQSILYVPPFQAMGNSLGFALTALLLALAWAAGGPLSGRPAVALVQPCWTRCSCCRCPPRR